MSKKILIIALLGILTACGQQPAPPGMKIGKPYEIEGKTYYPAYDATYDKIGTASWYGPGFHGKFTANGEKFNQNDLTAAHPTLPMPSLVRVTNIENGKSAILRVNDRGPFKSNRIIDLSRKSAQTLGIHSLAKVRVQFLKEETEQYIAQRQASPSGDIDMQAYNEQAERRKEESIARSNNQNEAEIVESTISTGHVGQTVDAAAPVLTVDSGDLAKPAPSSISVKETQPVVFSHEEKQAAVEEAPVEVEVAQAPAPRAQPAPVAKKPVEIHESSNDEIEPGAITLNAPSKSKAAAASKIAGKKPEPVKLKEASPSAGGGSYFIQAGSFAGAENAEKLKSKLAGIAKVKVEEVMASGRSWWRVRVGPFSSKGKADDGLQRVHSAGVADARVVRQ